MEHISEGLMRIFGEMVLNYFPGFFLGAVIGGLQCGLFFVLNLPENPIVIGVMFFTSVIVSGLLCEFSRRYMGTD
ncbi:hypothetical protein [Sneathiella glossodoripedis]|uniref:hypothetical protein n=1 Tax=Sneathiella glossodoripedis TaxID=418853 RepID=UPI00046F5F73|nr:hypothetical protein [Sneathiella glossodoripedis]